MKKTTFLIVIFTMLAVSLFAQQLTVAVRAFEVSGGLSQDEGNAITDIFVSELVSTGRIRVVDRNSFDAIMAEMKFGASSWSDNENVARLGRAINASYIIQGTVTSLGGRIIITVRVLDINTIQFVSSPNLQLVKMDEIFTKLPLFVRDLALNLAGNSTIYKVGDIGPSGGYVFFDRGSYTDGWRYLEAAPTSAEFAESTSRHGDSTVENINRTLERLRALDINGNKGWRLPTSNELLNMFGSLYRKELGNFKESIYVSSDTWSNQRATGRNMSWQTWTYPVGVDFKSGNTINGVSSFLVRGIRAF